MQSGQHVLFAGGPAPRLSEQGRLLPRSSGHVGREEGSRQTCPKQALEAALAGAPPEHGRPQDLDPSAIR